MPSNHIIDGNVITDADPLQTQDVGVGAVSMNAAIGTTIDAPFVGTENATARTLVSLLKGIKNLIYAGLGITTLPQREPFVFRPGSAALAGGAVASGTRSSGATVNSGATPNVTVWGTEVVYEPRRAGKVDGLTTGGVIWGQLTIGIVASGATPNGKLTARIRNKSGTWTTVLTLTGAIVLGVTEIFKTYDIPYLLTTTNFNAVPFGIAIGVESDSGTNTATARIMESSYISGEIEPGT